MSIRILMLPLDERPCNAVYPRYLAPVGGVELLMPPVDLMPSYRTPGDSDALGRWLLDHLNEVDAAVVSVDLLGYGGLIPSRIGHETVDEVSRRLEVIREAKRRRPDTPFFGFNIIMRTSNSCVNTEEPDYWTPHGASIFRISQLMDMVERGDDEKTAELDLLKAQVPSEHLRDYLRRRERNHAVNRSVIQMVADGVFDFVFLSQDDASEYGLPAREQRTLRADIRAANVGDRVVVYPGADEVGMVLMARAACHLAGYTPRFFPRWSSTGAERIVALYEDRPLDQTVRGEVYCAGGVVIDSPREADVLLFLNAPGESQSYPEYAAISRTVETPARNLPDFLSALRHYVGYKQVAVADVAYCNGADPALARLLPRFIAFPQLAAYAGWNTAANTIGTVVAHAALRTLGLHSGDDSSLLAREAAHQTFLFHRILEDYGYQTVVRTTINHALAERELDGNRLHGDTEDVRQEAEQSIRRMAEDIFNNWFAGKPSNPDPTIHPTGWRLDRVSLPWNRTFEIDLGIGVEVEPTRAKEPTDA